MTALSIAWSRRYQDAFSRLAPCAETKQVPHIVPYAYRSFDRQYLILDTRLIDFPRPSLWITEGSRQVFISEPHTNVITDGPAITFAALVPDMHYFQGQHGGRVQPLYRDAAAAIPNIAPRLLNYLQQVLGRNLDSEDLLAYVAAVVADSGYSRRFRNDLAIPGVRVPLSADSKVWDETIALGSQVASLHTLATRYPNPTPYQLLPSRPPGGSSPRITRG